MTATAVPAYEVYHRAFETNQVGSAAAVGVALTVLIFALTVTVSRLSKGGAVIGRGSTAASPTRMLVVFAVLALVPVRAASCPPRSRPAGSRTPASRCPDGLHWDNFADAWNRGQFGTYLRSSARHGGRRRPHGRAVHAGRVRLRHDAVPRLARCCSTSSCSG